MPNTIMPDTAMRMVPGYKIHGFSTSTKNINNKTGFEEPYSMFPKVSHVFEMIFLDQMTVYRQPTHFIFDTISSYEKSIA